MARRRRSLIVGALAVMVIAALMIAAAPANAGNGPGCDPSRPAVAHHAGGVPVDPQPQGAPVPCMTFTGQTLDTAMVGVTQSGAAFYGPIQQLDLDVPIVKAAEAVVVRSRNLGAYWQRIVPGPATVPVSGRGGVIAWMSVDPETSRLWYVNQANLYGTAMSFSDDEGATWQESVLLPPSQGSNMLIEGPAPSGGMQPTGYPHVVYYCANLGEVPFGAHGEAVCHRSLDGGQTFLYEVGSSPDSIPARDECGGPTGFSAETRVGTVGRDGNLYFPKNWCGQGNRLDLAVSTDEGMSWKTTKITDTEVQYLYPPALAADDDNNLFLAWKGAGGLPYLTVSTDAGTSWSTPIEVGAPGLTGIRQTAISAREPGHIVISYLGSTDGGTTFNAYMTESRNADGADPVFWSAPVNDPAQPVALGTEVGTFGDRIQALNNTIGADSTPWAAFHCAYTTLCPGIRIGIAGRLAWPTGG